MRSLEEAHPRRGLSIPVLTVLDAEGGLLETDQRALVRHLIQAGYGADVVFAAGTTGEWDRVDNGLRQLAVQICVEEVAKANSELGASQGRAVEAWAGVTAHTASETLENLEFAIEHGADAAVLAPLSIRGIDDPVRFVARDVADLLDARPRRIPVFLYDNAEIALDPKTPHIRTRQVKAMSRLDFVRGIKVSAPRRVLGNYTKAAASFRERGEFGIYVGSALLIFDLFRPRGRWLGALSEHWNRYRLSGALPIGVVAGPANVFPREWARAWQVCRSGDAERMDELRALLEAFKRAYGKRPIACFKRGLLKMGVIGSDAVAQGTPALGADEAALFDERFEAVRAMARETVAEPWLTLTPDEPAAPSLGSYR